MQQEKVNNSLAERLKSCPKLECNFLFRRLYNTNDTTVSEISFEESDFWKRDVSEDLYSAAKRFENNVSSNYELSDNLPTVLYPEDRLVEPIRCTADGFPDFDLPQSPTERRDNTMNRALQSSSFFPNLDFEVDQNATTRKQSKRGIPKLEPISDKENSFSSQSTDIVSDFDFGPSIFKKESVQETEEKAVDKSGNSSAFPSPKRVSFDLDEMNKFSDVKTAKSLNLYVDEYPQTSFFSLLDSLQSNYVVERIEVFRKRTTHEEIRTRTLEDMDNLFHVIHDLSTLAELVVWNFHPEELSSLCHGISDKMSIKYLQLHMECGTVDQQTLETISSMPSLLALELEVAESFPVWSLLESNSLILLGVFSTGFDFDPNDVLRLATRIRTNSVLRVLDLEPRIPSWCIGAVMASLRFSHTSQLETFRFSCQNDNEEQGDACVEEILKTIDYETSLRVLWNHSSTSFLVSEEMRRRIMEVVSRNLSLKEFHLFGYRDEEC